VGYVGEEREFVEVRCMGEVGEMREVEVCSGMGEAYPLSQVGEEVPAGCISRRWRSCLR